MFLAALGLLATHWQDFLIRLPSHGDFFSARMLVLFWITLGLVKIVHELGHAFCCKRMGAEVQEIGILVLFFFPTLYCNVSDGWTLPNKWKRMAISAAGIYVEMVIASGATFFWWFSDASSLVHNFSFALMAVCSVHTLVCNANPLMRFDGYYVLSDWMEIPNLAQQANQKMQGTALRWLGVELRNDETRHAAFLSWFGIASAIYRWYVVALTLFFFAEFLKERHLASLGYLLVVVGLATLIGGPTYQVVRWLHQLGRFPELKAKRVWLTTGILAALLTVVFLLPFSRKVRGVALIQVMPDQVQRVIVPDTEGFLQEGFAQ